jgi:hypothetical protein
MRGLLWRIRKIEIPAAAMSAGILSAFSIPLAINHVRRSKLWMPFRTYVEKLYATREFDIKCPLESAKGISYVSA